MDYARSIGRIGALAVALGVGVAVIPSAAAPVTTPGGQPRTVHIAAAAAPTM